MPSNSEFFAFLSAIGVTKHLGALKATNEILDSCKLSPASCVLDVGCGVGITAAYIAKRYGCRVVGIDLTPEMLPWAHKRAEKEGVSRLVELKVADARNLPFKSGTFDLVLSESVIIFTKDRKAVLKECSRVLKKGGLLAINEGCWTKTPVPQHVSDYVRDSMGYLDIPASGYWKKTMKNAGLGIIHAASHPYDFSAESTRLSQFGLPGFLGIMFRFFSLYLSKPDFRSYTNGLLKKPTLDIVDYFGGEICVGRKVR